jgi:hypothetical protein
MAFKWIVYCIAASVALLVVVIAVQGFDVWAALIAAVILVCPLISIWVWREGTCSDDEDGGLRGEE